MTRTTTRLLVGLLVAALATACTAAPDRPGAVAAVVDEVAVPSHEAAAAATRELAEVLGATCRAGDVAAAREAWHRAVAARGRQRSVLAGPGMRSTSIGRVDWVVDARGVEALLGDAGRTVDANALAGVPAGQRGLGTVGLLLATHDLAAEPRACGLAMAAAELAAEEQQAVVAAWTEGSDGESAFRDRLDGSAAAARSTQGALDELVRAQVFELDDLVDGLVAGERDSVDDPGGGDGEGPGGGGVHRLRGTLDGLAALYADDRLGGLLPASQRDALTAALADADAALAPLDDDLATADDDQLGSLHDALDRVRVTVRTDVVSSLDVLVGFSQNDGDAG